MEMDGGSARLFNLAKAQSITDVPSLSHVYSLIGGLHFSMYAISPPFMR